MDTVKAAVTNQRVADDLGITHSMVSRIRSGDRLPSLQLVRRIADRLGWAIDEQIATLDPEKYAAGFEELLAKRYDQ
jgi:transcriptional regulator with XRE-family HTH domain